MAEQGFMFLPDVTPAPEEADVMEIPYRSKRPHKKSRTGCKNCKARKVKCNEERPVCRTCRLRKENCVYPSTTTNATRIPSYSSKPASASKQSTSLPSPSPSDGNSTPYPSSSSQNTQLVRSANPTVTTNLVFLPPHVHQDELKLMWFYSTVSCGSFSVRGVEDDPVKETMRSDIVQQAFSNRFLLDTLFGLSGLHMKMLGQDFDEKRALLYRTRAFEGYRKAIAEANPDSFTALTANSLLLTALTSGSFRDPEAPDLYIIDWMLVWRGIGVIVNFVDRPVLEESSIRLLFSRPPMCVSVGTPYIPHHLLLMISSIPADDPEFFDTTDYYEALEYLGCLYQGLQVDSWSTLNLRIVTWFTYLPAAFCDLARQRRPRALVILAHYAVFLKLLKTIWWLEGVGDRTLGDIRKYLSSEWHPVLQVPFEAMGVDDSLAICRLILKDPTWMPPFSDPSSRAAFFCDELVVDVS
ncbi:hypothetical protein S40285_04161 [Stachybotrys chlorohalonatus IBT 40285]|uniref:Zn(2)-C6 fungal-type domain-containing protein n=1 Tax=Stachybotrys chlorohalonatus (strain IBT 40285) TaxID=1283841 RepID=A0A084QCQ2_STAC4|nr:hypothetical protein S40285_04161 [Stachybotrys chlorohalonata IBT 40285]